MKTPIIYEAVTGRQRFFISNVASPTLLDVEDKTLLDVEIYRGKGNAWRIRIVRDEATMPPYEEISKEQLPPEILTLVEKHNLLGGARPLPERYTSMAAANKGFLAGVAEKIDRVLKADISTEDMIDELAILRDRIRQHLKAQRRAR